MMSYFLPELQVVFAGSSILELYKGFSDLSRRVLECYLPCLSFREYIAIKTGKHYPSFSLGQILNCEVIIEDRPLPLFEQYLEEGYYPYFNEPGYYERLLNTINQSLEVDIPSFANMNISTSRKLMQLLFVISKSVSFGLNVSKLCRL